MSKRRRQQLLLAALGIVLVFLVWRRLQPVFGGQAAVGGARAVSSARGSADERRAGSLPEVEELRLDDLRSVFAGLEGGRNPFEVDRPAPPPPQPTPVELRAAIRERVEARPEPTVPAQPARPTPPPVDVVFLGSFGPASDRLAVFTDGREVYNAGQGEVLKDKFVVVRIGFESADLGFVGFPEAPTQRLEIGG